MSILTINIGLEKNTGGSVSVAGLLEILCNNFHMESAQIKQSETEPTLIFRAYYISCGYELAGLLYDLCIRFKQDCVAYSFDGGVTGRLVGPNATAWGEFNPDFFIP